MKRCLIYLFAFLFWAPPAFSQVVAPEWGHLSALPDARNGRYDDMDFVTASRGWVVNLSGEIWHTEDAGASWDLQLVQTSSAWPSVPFHHELGPRARHIVNVMSKSLGTTSTSAATSRSTACRSPRVLDSTDPLVLPRCTAFDG